MKPTDPSVSEIVILCGGRGTRLKPMTDEVPKALVKLNDRPILDYILDFYQLKGFKRFVLCVGYKGEKIKAYLSGKRPELQIEYSDAGESASMLERIYSVRDQLRGTFFVTYGDTLVDLEVEEIMKFHQLKGVGATIVTAKIQNPFGLVTVDDTGLATSFAEKPVLKYYIGSFAMQSSILHDLSAEMRFAPDGKGLVNLFLSLMKQRQLGVFEHEGKQLTFNTESERQLAEQGIGEFYTVEEKGTERNEYAEK